MIHRRLPGEKPPSSCPVHIGTLSLVTGLLAKGFAVQGHPPAGQCGGGNYGPESLTTMLRTIFTLSVLAAGLSSSSALGRADAGQRIAGCSRRRRWRHPPRPGRQSRYLLRRQGKPRHRRCRYRQGHRYPAAADEARPPRAAPRDAAARTGPRPDDDDRYYLDDPEDMARFRRKQLEEEGRVIPPPADEYDPNSDSIGDAYPPPPQDDGTTTTIIPMRRSRQSRAPSNASR